jgi:hypothetical protein
MTLQEFEVSFNPILNRWKRAYSGDQLQLVYEEVKTLLKTDFDRVVGNLLGSSRVQPMIPDFRKAVMDLGIRALDPKFQTLAPNYYYRPEEDFVYHVIDNVWANNEYVFIRGDKQIFVSKKDSPAHPLVIQANEVKAERIKEIKDHLAKNTYSIFMASGGQSKSVSKISNLRPIDFNDREPA